MNENQTRALLGLVAAVGLVVVAQQLARSQGPALGIPAAMAPLLVGVGAWAISARMA